LLLVRESDRAGGKLLKTCRGEVAEWLKAALFPPRSLETGTPASLPPKSQSAMSIAEMP